MINIHGCYFQGLQDTQFLGSVLKPLQDFILDPAFPQSDKMFDNTKRIVEQTLKMM
jgi:hypothetical protein